MAPQGGSLSESQTSPRVVVYTPSSHTMLPPLSLTHKHRHRTISLSQEQAILLETTKRVSPKEEAMSAAAEGSLTKGTEVSEATSLVQGTETDRALTSVLEAANLAPREAPRNSKKIDLSFSLFRNGRAEGAPSSEAWEEILGLYEGAFSVEVSPPFLIIRLEKVPPKPWPLTIGDLPVWFTSHKTAMPMQHGKLGGGKSVLNELDLRTVVTVDSIQLRTVASHLIHTIGVIHDVYWWTGCWTVTVADDAIVKNLPMRIGLSPVFYRRQQDAKKQDHAGVERGILPYYNGPEANFASFSSGWESGLENFDLVHTNDPYNGRVEGLVLALGLEIHSKEE